MEDHKTGPILVAVDQQHVLSTINHINALNRQDQFDKMKKLDNQLLANITNRLYDGKSSREIQRELNVSKSAVNNTRNRLLIRPNTPPRGAPKKLTIRDKRKIHSDIISGRVKTAVEGARRFKAEFGVQISPQLVRNILKESGLKAKKKIKKPLISSANKKNRLQWALEHRSWTEDDWMRVIWSDETKINRINSDGIQYCWVQDSPGLSQAQVDPTLKHGGGSVMLWGCMTPAGVGKRNVV